MATRTRSSTEHWLLGQGKATLPPSQLPSGEDVLREILWKTESDDDIERSIACQMTKGTFELKCENKDGCGCQLKADPAMKCTVRKILDIYKRGAIPTAREDKIKDRCLKLYKNWKQLKAERNVKTASAIKKRDKFVEDLKPAFMAYHSQAEDLINSDPQRSDETKREDIEFLRDQKSQREAKISTADKVYTNKVIVDKQKQERKRQRESDEEKRKEKEKKARSERLSTVNLDELGSSWAGGAGGPVEASGEGERGAGGAGGPVEALGEGERGAGGAGGPVEASGGEQLGRRSWRTSGGIGVVTVVEESNNNNAMDLEFVLPSSPEAPKKKKRTKKKCGQTVHIPHNIFELCVPEGTKCKITQGQQVSYLSGLLNVLGCDLDKFTMSHSSAQRITKKVKKKLGQKIREKYREDAKKKKARLVIHYDGKLVEEIAQGKVKKKKRDRLAVVARSPDIPEQLLGIPELPTGSGLNQTAAIRSLTEPIEELIIGTSQDTCATNTGVNRGVVVRLSKHLNVLLLRFDCRRHIVELWIKHFGEVISGRATTCTGDTLFSRFRDGFDGIRSTIDYEILITFDWPQDDESFLSKKASEALSLVKKYLAEDTFVRGDYRDLCEAVYVFLSGEKKINGKQFKFRLPHKVSHARFMQRGLNYIPLQMLGNQADYMKMSERELMEVDVMSTFVALFYTPWFLQSSLTAEAGMLDLQAIGDMRKLRDQLEEEYNQDKDDKKKIQLEAAQKCLGNMYEHGVYLTEDNIVLGLAGNKMTMENKRVVADEILSLVADPETDTENFHYRPEEKFDVTVVWPEEQEEPDLRRFIGRKSLLLFHHLRMMDPESMGWLALNPEEWDLDPNYNEFRSIINSIDVVNDSAER